MNKVSHAIIRKPHKDLTSNLPEGSLGIPDFNRLMLQYNEYCKSLKECGVLVIEVPADEKNPSGFFMNDIGIITNKMAVLSSKESMPHRTGEINSIISVLAESKIIHSITEPGKINGSDVIQINNHFYIGLSDKTNHEGASQLAFFLKETGHDVTVLSPDLPVSIHLESAITYCGGNTIMIYEGLSKHYAFIGYDMIIVPETEQDMTNSVYINDTLIVPLHAKETCKTINDMGIKYIQTPMTELMKIKGGMINLSLFLPEMAIEEISLPVSLTQKEQAA